MAKVFNVLRETLKGYVHDSCYLYACALTYLTLLSIVPVLAMAFGIATTLGYEKMVKKDIMIRFREYEEVASKMIDFADSYMAQVQGGWLAVFAALFFLSIVVILFNTLENALHEIWKVEVNRGIAYRLLLYAILLILTPIFLVGSSILTVTADELLGSSFPLVDVLPLLISWVFFILLYLCIPKNRVPLKAAALGGILAGTAFQLTQGIFFHFQIGVSQYNAIYGSFAALPLFLLWVQISWQILLTGAEITYHSS